MTGTKSLRLLPFLWALGGLLLVVSASHCAQAAVLPLDNADSGDYNGMSVDISGDTIIVGGCCGGTNAKGWAQVFIRTGTSGSWTWEHQQTLTTDDASLPSNAQFGNGVGIDGNRAVIGAPRHDTAYCFSRVGSTWNEDTATQMGPASADGFGHDIKIDQNRIIVGALASDKAFAYSSEIINGQNLPASGERGEFGASVAISNTRAVVGDPDKSITYFYNYEYNEGTDTWAWVEETAISRGSDDCFGASVAIDGDWAIVGADETNLGNQYDAGSAVIYHHDGTGWGDPVTLAPSELALSDHFGASVAISGNTAVVGAINQGPFGSRTGSVYVFTRICDAWIQSGKLQPPDGVDGDEFGNSVAIDGDWIVVGAWKHDSNTGAAYVFETPDYVPIPGDANLDNKVDETDVAILDDNWGTTSGMSWTDGDFNDDHAVDAIDASILAAQWHVGISETTTSVPEPTAIVLLVGLLLMLAVCRRA